MSGARDRSDLRFEARAALLAATLLVVSFVATCFGSAEEPRWRAQYFANPTFSGRPLTRWEREMRFEWDRQSPDPAIPPDRFSARFESCLVLPSKRRITFLLTSDDHASFTIDGEPVLELPGVHPLRSTGKERALEAGSHLLRIDYIEAARFAAVGLSASLDGRAPKQIPNDFLRRPARGRCG